MNLRQSRVEAGEAMPTKNIILLLCEKKCVYMSIVHTKSVQVEGVSYINSKY